MDSLEMVKINFAKIQNYQYQIKNHYQQSLLPKSFDCLIVSFCLSDFARDIYLIEISTNILFMYHIVLKLCTKIKSMKIKMENTYNFYAERPNNEVIKRAAM